MSVFIPIPKTGGAEECSNYWTIALIFHSNKVMLKILQAGLQQYMNQEIPDIESGFRKSKETRDQIADIHWFIEKKQGNSRGAGIYFCFIDYVKVFVWITTNCGKFLK